MNTASAGLPAITIMLLLAAMAIDASRPHTVDRPAGRLRVSSNRYKRLPYHPNLASQRTVLAPARRISRHYAQPRLLSRPKNTMLQPRHKPPKVVLQPRLGPRPLRTTPQPRRRQTRPQSNRPPFVNFRNLPTQSACPVIHNPDIRHVMTAAVGLMNRGSSAPHIARSIAHGGVERCKKCVSGRCFFDHKKVTVLAAMAPLCESTNCVCGVERFGKEKFCEISGWTKRRRPAYNINIECDGRKIYPRRKIHKSPKIHHVPKVQETPARRLPNRPFRPKSTRPRTTTATTTAPAPTFEQESDEFFDVSGDEPFAEDKPAPIVEWDEVTSEATVVYPKRIISTKEMEDDDLIQKAR